MAQVAFPTYIAQDGRTVHVGMADSTIGYQEFKYSSKSDLGVVKTSRYAASPAAGAGFLKGSLTFRQFSIARSMESNPDELAEYRAFTLFENRIQDDSEDLPWVEIPFRAFVGQRTYPGTATYDVDSVAMTKGEYITTLDADASEIEEGMFVNLDTTPVKCCFVYQRLSGTEFRFVPNHRLAVGTTIRPAEKILAVSESFTPTPRTEQEVSSTRPPRGKVFRWNELTQIV